MKKLWFKRKCFGWGWQPATWEGWLVLAVFLFLEIGNAYRFGVDQPNATRDDVRSFALQSIFLVFILMLVCLRTGEKPRWQWGKRVEHEEDVTEPR